LQEPEREALKLLEDATRSCNNIDEQRALDALMRGVQPAQEPSHIVQSNGKHSPLLTHMMNKRTTPPKPAQEPVARVSGTYGGRFTYDPINPAAILPIGMALYSSPQEKT